MANEIKIEISAKFEEGGAPSIKTIVKEIDNVYKTPSQEEKKVIDILKILGTQVSGETTSDKILKIAMRLDFEGYNYLKKVIGKSDINVKDIDNFVRNIAKTYDTAPVRIKEFRKIFDPYFKILTKGVKDESLGVIFTTDSFPKYSSSVIAPLGYWLIGYMNSLPSFIQVLNNVSRSLKTEQIYLNLTPSSLVFNKKIFEQAEFKFEYGGNAKNADNTGIKFSMK
jgi:hypothetical protein